MLAHQLQCNLPEDQVHISVAPFTMPDMHPLEIDARPAETQEDCGVFLDEDRSFVVELFRCGTCYYSTPQFESLREHSHSTGHHVQRANRKFPGLKVAFRPRFQTSEPEFITSWFRERTPLDLSHTKDVTMHDEACDTAGTSHDAAMPDASASAVVNDTTTSNLLSEEIDDLNLKENTASSTPHDETIALLAKQHTPLLGRAAVLAAVRENPDLPACAICSADGTFRLLVYDGKNLKEVAVPTDKDPFTTARSLAAIYLRLFYPVTDEDQFRMAVQCSWPAAWVDTTTRRPTVHLFDGATSVKKTADDFSKAYLEASRFLTGERSRLLTGC
ncbi:MAG: hypothetical protein KVP17_003008 [Porospora cf. gigantea B]|uniref:uncharacterized protein n=1 Tax=Porospora cf. gigantea B TaxID=2853592 RepID=UPI003571ED0D|nr:MAG: hypothetical protein KVP17_003008 [Porospora cf. gigantea B]